MAARKLTPEQRQEVKDVVCRPGRLPHGTLTLLAKRYGVSVSSIHHLRKPPGPREDRSMRRAVLEVIRWIETDFEALTDDSIALVRSILECHHYEIKAP